MENPNGLSRTDADDGNDQLVAQELDSVHYLPLLDGRTGQERMELIDDEHAHMASPKKMDDLIPQLGCRIGRTIRRIEPLKDGDVQPLFVGARWSLRRMIGFTGSASSLT